MTFSTYLFLFLFLPLVLGGYFALSRAKNPLWQRLFLLTASLVFIGYAGFPNLLWLLASGAAAYLAARVLQDLPASHVTLKRVVFLCAILVQVGLLAYCKYYNFFAENLALLFRSDYHARSIFLPLGISFFTFQQLLLLIRVNKGEYRVGDVLTYALFLAFFPYRSSGPIVDYRQMEEQIQDAGRRTFDSTRFVRGLYLLVVGLAKKLILADTLAIFVNNGFPTDSIPALPAAWAVALSYTFQLYFDFSGYSDMACGVSLMLGFDLPQNFDSPYKSESCTVFWRRWHMTLGRALTHCVYIPLGGNRKGTARTCLNVFLVMAVSGIWHGASWTFILWGAIYGLIQALERVLMPYLERIPRAIRVCLTFLCVNFLWVLFRAPSLSSAVCLWRGMFNFQNLSLSSVAPLTLDGIVDLPDLAAILFVGGMLLVSFVAVFCFENAYRKAQELTLSRPLLAWLVFLFVLSFVHLSRLSTFIYVNF